MAELQTRDAIVVSAVSYSAYGSSMLARRIKAGIRAAVISVNLLWTEEIVISVFALMHLGY
jgi:hypothetical protein